MSWNRFIFKTHKWLAVAVGLLTLAWFVSGIVMVTPPAWFGAPGPLSLDEAGGPQFQEIVVTVPQAIAAVEAAGNAVEVTGAGFRRIAGRLLYEIATKEHGSHLVDALSGEPFAMDPATARQLASRALPAATLPEPALVTTHDTDYRYGPLPAYRFALGDSRATSVYVVAATGEVRATNRWGRLRGFIAGLHTFDFLHAVTSNRGVRGTLVLASLVGTLMSLFGLAILWIQFVNWRERRRAPRTP